jgi:hypothetical protein
MNRTLLWKLFRKDTRMVWPWIGLTWIVALLPLEQAVWGTSWLQIGSDESIAVLITLIVAAQLVQADDPGSTQGFMRTRPASPLTQLAVKWAVLGMWFIAPICVLRVLPLVRLNLGLGLGDYALVVGAFVPPVSAVIGVAVLVGLLTRRLGYFAGMFVLLAVLYAAMDEWRNQVRMSTHRVSSWSTEGLIPSGELAFQTVAALSTLVAAGIFARTRSWPRLAVAVVVSGAAALAVLMWWPVNFAPVFANPGGVAPHAEWPDLQGVAWKWEDATPPNVRGRQPVPIYGGEGFNGVSYKNLIWYCDPTGVPPPWYVCQVAYDSELVLADGRKIHSRSDWHGYTQNNWPAGPTSFNPSAPKPNAVGVSLSNFRQSEVLSATERARVSGQVTFEIRRPVVLGSLPLQAGASFAIGGRRYTIGRITPETKGMRVEYTCVSAFTPFRGFQTGDPLVVLYNPVRQEKADSSGGDGNGWGSELYFVGNEVLLPSSVLHFEKDPSGKTRAVFQPIDEAWMRDARLYLISSEAGGTKTVPFDFSGLSLPKE